MQAYRGLAGMIIIDDDVEQALDIPHDYGVDDIPIVIMDANFTDDGQLDETFDPNLGLQGAVPLRERHYQPGIHRHQTPGPLSAAQRFEHALP